MTSRFVEFKMDTSGLETSLKAMIGVMEPRRILKVAYPPARKILSDAQNKAPVDLGFLQASGYLIPDYSKIRFKIGFGGVASEYAGFQDGYFWVKKGQREIIIRPKRKKWLYVPLTRRGVTAHKPGADPESEGLTFGGFVHRKGGGRGGGTRRSTVKADYILMKEVVVRIKAYGSTVGPNQYFSGTLTKRRKWFPRELAKLISKEMERSV